MAGKSLSLNWQQLHGIMKRAVERGLDRRMSDEIPWIGMDEKSFRKGHKYISFLNDIEGARVVDVVEGREGKAADKLIIKALDKKQREMVCGVAIDRSAPYISAINRLLPHADIVHDKFHIAKHLNEAVDKTRHQEHRLLMKDKDEILKGTNPSFLFDGVTCCKSTKSLPEALQKRYMLTSLRIGVYAVFQSMPSAV